MLSVDHIQTIMIHSRTY